MDGRVSRIVYRDPRLNCDVSRRYSSLIGALRSAQSTNALLTISLTVAYLLDAPRHAPASGFGFLASLWAACRLGCELSTRFVLPRPLG